MVNWLHTAIRQATWEPSGYCPLVLRAWVKPAGGKKIIFAPGPNLFAPFLFGQRVYLEPFLEWAEPNFLGDIKSPGSFYILDACLALQTILVDLTRETYKAGV